MPKDTMTEESQWKLPAATPLPVRLSAVTEATIQYTNKKGEPDSFTKWEWEFDITDGEYAGLKVWGDTESSLTNRPDNKVRQWSETLRGKPFEIGEGLDTDDLLGLEALIVVDNTTYVNKAGETKFITPIVDIYPADAAVDLDPPF